MSLMKKYLNSMNREKSYTYTLLLVSTLILSLIISACGGGPQKVEKKEKPSYNIIILLDLSDRIIAQTGQADRDKKLIKYIGEKMTDIIRDNNGVDKSKEIIKIRIADQDNIPYSTAQFSDSLFFKMSRDVRGGIPAVRKILKERFPRNLETLFDLATFSDNPADYNGANISKYFTRDLSTDIKRDSLSNNLLFILTDGYLNVGKNPNLMIDVHNKFPELKVLVLEMTPKNLDYESERLQKSWDQWFADMSVQGYALRNAGPIQAIEEDIDKFLDGSLELTVPGDKNELITESDPTPKVKPKQTTAKKEKNKPNKTAGKPKKVVPDAKVENQSSKPKKMTLTFPNGDIYVGDVLNGNPHGIGTMTFKKTRQLSENDINKTMVEAGDYLTGTWNKGEVQIGKLYDSNGTYKRTIAVGGD